MPKSKEQEFIQLKYALAFKKLLDENKAKKLENKAVDIKDHNLVDSLGKLSSATGLRVATLSDVFTGKSNPEAVTIDLIIEGLGKTFSQFGFYYDHLDEKKVLEYRKEIEKSRKERAKKK